MVISRIGFVLAAWLGFSSAAFATPPPRDDISDRVGASAGDFRVDESGAATYSMPIYTVPGTAGVAPSISVSYSSSAGESSMGKGWALSGASAITRCRATRESGDFLDASNQPIDGFSEPINFTSTDKFCLDGQRLMAELNSAGAVVANTYRLELDAYTRVLAVFDATPASGPRAFRVQRRDGSTAWYGDFNGCTVSGQQCTATRSANRTDALILANTLDANGATVLRTAASAWALNRSYDSAGNYIDYQYTNDSLNGEFYLTSINFTGYASFATATGNSLAPYASVVMNYIDLPQSQWKTGFNAGSRYVRSKQLQSIDSLDGANTLKHYRFSYQTAFSGSFEPILTSVLECRDNQLSVCLRPTEFEWSTAVTGYGSRKTASQSALGTLVDYKTGDINGDGRVEMVWIRNVNTGACPTNLVLVSTGTKDAAGLLSFGNPIDTGICTGWSSNSVFSGIQRYWQLLDYNGDGRDDLMLAQPPSAGVPNPIWKIYPALTTGIGFSSTAIDTPIPVYSPGTLGSLQLADFNGDGLLDVLNIESIPSFGEQLVIRFFERSGLEFGFSAPYLVDWSSDLPASFNCPLDCEPKLSEATRKLGDVNGDGQADILMGYRPISPNRLTPEEIANPQVIGPRSFWILPSQRVETPLKEVRFKYHTSTSPDLPFLERAPVIDGERADFNGDSLADVLVCVTANSCAQYLNTGLGGAKSFIAIGSSVTNANQRQLLDINQDGRTDLVFRASSSAGSDGVYTVRYAGPDGILGSNQLMPGCGFNSCGAQAFENGQSLFADFDGDGYADFLAFQNPPNENDNVRTAFSGSGGAFKPRDVIVKIKNGYGAETNIDYLPLTNKDVYRRAANSRNSLIIGRGSAVHDLLVPIYVVARVQSSAPVLNNPLQQSSIHYRYAGAKMQGGGRGFLGFAEVVSFDSNYSITGLLNCGPSGAACHTASVSRYFQSFPYVGAPFQSETYVMAGSFAVSSCRGTGRTGDACAQTSAAFPSFDTGLNKRVKFTGHAMACQSANGSTDLCPAPFNAGTSQCFTGALNGALAPTLSIAGSESRMSNGDAVNRFTPNGKPQGLFAYVLGSQDLSFELQSPGGTQATAEVFNTFCYGTNGNLTVSETQTAATSSADMNGNPSNAAKIRRKGLRNLYTDDVPNWRLGRLVSAGVIHGVKENGDANFTETSRISTFDYQAGNSKFLLSEKLSAATAPGSGDEAYNVNTYYDLDRYGNRTATYTCSNDVTEVLCKDPANTSNPMLFHPTGTTIRRFVRSSFDSRGRYSTGARGAFYDPAQTPRLWSERSTGTVLARDEFGEVTSADDANGVNGQVLRGTLGRDYYGESETGASSTTTYRWCTGYNQGVDEVACAPAAAFRKQIIASGAPIAWSYHDVLGRAIIAMVQSNFDAPAATNALVEVCTFFDSHGRTVRTTEPKFARTSLNGAPDFSATFNGCDAPASLQSFDILGRPRLTTQPDGGITDLRYGISSKTVVGPQGNFLEIRSLISKTAPNNGSESARTWFEVVNAAGERVEIKDPNNFSIFQEFDQVGNLRRVARVAGPGRPAIQTIAEYDDLGRKLSQTDADMGYWQYRYNAMGELVSQTDGKSQTITHAIDALGRVWQTQTPGVLVDAGEDIFKNGFEDGVKSKGIIGLIVDTMTFDTATNGLGMLQTSTRVEPGLPNYTQTVTYDSLARVRQTATLIDAQTSVETVVYDSIGRAFKQFTQLNEPGITYLEGVETAFNSRGYPHKLCRSTDLSGTATSCVITGSNLYYQSFEYSPRGQVTSERRADSVNLAVNRSFDAQTGRLNVQTVNGGSSQSWQQQYDLVGNLMRRDDFSTGQNEVMVYDKLDRLKSVSRNSQISMALEYDVLGNICQKTREGVVQNYQYGAASGCALNAGAVSSPHQVTQAWGKSYQYDGNGDLASRFGNNSNLTLSYDASRMTRSLTSTGLINARSRFQYGPSGSRYKRIDEKNGSITRTLRYFGSVEKETTPTRTLLRQSIGGFLLINRTVSSNAREYRYLFADSLGSVDLITNETGQIIERMSFDAHGARRLNSSWVNPIQNYAPDTTLRGYTGHEMMDDLGLIHMNARIYDAELGRFLQADSMVEADATQGLNRYSYVLNNPLSSTDPSGHLSKKALGIFKSIIGIAISVWLPGAGGFLASIFGTAGSYVAAGFIAGSISGGLEGGLWGAFSAGLFYGIGSHFQKLAGADKILSSAQRAAKVATHAIAGGTLNVLQGGKFGHGFVSAGVVEAVSPTVMKIPNSYAKVALSALVGGSVSAATGGKFGNGAITGAFQMAFNELAHAQRIEDDKALQLGIDEVKKYNPESIETDREIGGKIYELNSKIYASDPVFSSCTAAQDCGINLDSVNIPKGGRVLYDWHTHGSGDPNSPAFNWFSAQDLFASNNSGLKGSLLGTPSGLIRLVRPGMIFVNDAIMNDFREPTPPSAYQAGMLIDQQRLFTTQVGYTGGRR